MVDFYPPTWPTPAPYAGTTLNPGPDPAVLVLYGIGALLVGLVLVTVIVGVTVWLDSAHRRERGVEPIREAPWIRRRRS